MACCAIFPRSKLDSAQTTRRAYSCADEAHRVITGNSLIDKRNSRIELTYRIAPNCECVCTVKYYDDRTEEINTVTVIADCCGSLNSKYFTLYSAKDATQFYVWYNVGCTGVDPAVCCATGLEVNIVSCDAASVIALATKQTTDANCAFCSTVLSDVITITNADIGLSTATADGCGLCTFTYDNPNAGKNALQYTLCLSYDCCARLISVDRI